MSLAARSARVSWAQQDGHPSLGVVAIVGLLAASALAAVGLPPGDLHGPLHRLGIMDPLCGGSRAARAFMSGDWSAAWAYNPGIFAVASVLGYGLSRWCYGRITGRWLELRLPRSGAVLAVAVALFLLEVNQQRHASLLR